MDFSWLTSVRDKFTRPESHTAKPGVWWNDGWKVTPCSVSTNDTTDKVDKHFQHANTSETH